MNSVTIVGCGYVGRRVATKLTEKDVDVSAVVRSKQSAERLKTLGFDTLYLDLDAEGNELINIADTSLFYFVPPPSTGVTDPRVENLIRSFDQNGHPSRVVYISTTGVYGNCNGRWIDESEPVKPLVDRSRKRLAAEQSWRQWADLNDRELVILRVSGIYGPDRLPLERLKQGLPLLREQDAPYSNRIHVDDLVNVCLATMTKGVNGAVYNVSDGNPSTMIDYFNRIADKAGLNRPPQIDRQEAEQKLSKGMLSYMNESRRLSNRKMLDELAIELQYPDLESGLSASV